MQSRRFVPFTVVAAALIAPCRGLTAPPITAAAFTRCGESLLVASQAGLVVRTWPSLEIQRKLDIAFGNVQAIAFSPVANVIAVAGGRPAQEGTCAAISWPDARMLARLETHTDVVMAVDWSSNGAMIATGAMDREVHLHNAKSGKFERSLAGHSAGVVAVRFVGPESLLASASIDQTVRVWDASTGKLVRTLDNHTGPVQALAVRPYRSADERPMLASAGHDRTVRLWQPSIGRMVRFVRLDAAPLAIGWSPDGSTLFASCTDGRVCCLDPETMKVIWTQPVVDGWAYSLAVHPAGKDLVVAGENGVVKSIAVKPAR